MGIIEFNRPSGPSRFIKRPEVEASLDTIHQTFGEISDDLHRLTGFGKHLAHTLLVITDPLDNGPTIGSLARPANTYTPMGIEHELGALTGKNYSEYPSRAFTDAIGSRIINLSSYGYSLVGRPVKPFYRADERDPSLHIHDIPLAGSEGTPIAIARIAIHGATIPESLGHWAQAAVLNRSDELKDPINTLHKTYTNIDNPSLSFLRSLELDTPADPNCHVIEFDVVQSTDTMLGGANGSLDAFLGAIKAKAAQYVRNNSLEEENRAVYIGNGGDNVRVAFSIPSPLNRADTEAVQKFITRNIQPHIQGLRAELYRVQKEYPEFNLRIHEATGFMQHEPSGEHTLIPLWDIAKRRKET